MLLYILLFYSIKVAKELHKFYFFIYIQNIFWIELRKAESQICDLNDFVWY